MSDLLKPLHSSQQSSNPSLPEKLQPSSLQEQDPAIIAAKPSTSYHHESVPDSSSATTSIATEPFPDIDPFLLHCSFLSGSQPLPLPYFAVALDQPIPNALRYIVLPSTMQVSDSSIQDPQSQVPGVSAPTYQQPVPKASRQPRPNVMLPPGWPFPGVDMSHAHFSTGSNSHTMGNNGFKNNPFGPNAPVSEEQINAVSNMRPMGNPQFGRPQTATSQAMFSSGPDHAVNFNQSQTNFTTLDSALTGAPRGPSAYHSNAAATLPTDPTLNSPASFDFHYTPAAGIHKVQPTLRVNQLPQNNFFHQQNQMGQMTSNSTAPLNGMMTKNTGPASHPNNMSTTYQAMMSPTFGPSPVPVQYQQQQHANFNGAPVNHNSHLTQGGHQNSSMVPFQTNNIIEHPRNHPVVRLDQSQLTRSKEWAGMYRFHVQATPPFVDLTRNVAPSEKPVICIKNIPYTITQNEIQQFLGKSMLPHSLTHLSTPGPASLPIFIIMERGTGKTQDCFVELPSASVTAACIERIENLIMADRPPKMAQRIVNVEMSSQGELMRELFPRAKNIMWDPTTGIPIMLAAVDGYGAGFRGFLTGEELNNVVRFAEMPQRSPFAIRCQQRTYEMTMSTLAKFPWASIYYTLEHRDLLFKAYFNQLAALLPKVFVEQYGSHRNQRVVGLDARLVASFVDAGLNCPGFNEAQKASILDLTNQDYTFRGVSHYGAAWPFETLTKPAGVGDYDIALWIELMKTGALSALDQSIVLAVGQSGNHYIEVTFDKWGQLMMSISEQGRKNVGFADLARMEQKLMKCMLLHGWEVCFGRSGINLYAGDQFALTQVEKKMWDLGVFELGVDPSGNLNSNKTGEPVADKSKGLDIGENNVTNLVHGQMIHFEDPFHGRTKSIASDSGFGGMHRTIDMQLLMKEVNEMAKEVHIGGSPQKAPHSAEKTRPSYAEALGNILVNTEMANAPGRIRAPTKTVSIKSPDGTVLNFSNSKKANKSSSNSPETNGDQPHPFSTPHRRLSNTSIDSHDNISPRTRTVSPKKPSSYTVKTTPRAENMLDPIGTPSRRSMQDNTINIGDTIDEETEDESILMRGRRARGGSQAHF
ncbi:hypothetical protein DV736_g496, partial [Chaetothyriales sp. CBS 134916]